MAPSLHLAQACIGAVWIGIPADSVVQAMALPAAPAMLPRRQGALTCVVEHAGQPVPVVDLARWVEVGARAEESAGAARVLILSALGRTIGLKVDSVGGLAEVEAQSVTRLHHDACADEVFDCVVRDPASGRVLSLLEVERLACLAAAWREDGADAPAQSSAQSSAEDAPTTLRSYAVLQAGAARLALAADALTEVLPMPALHTLGAGGGMAYCIWRGRHVPVLAHAALGLAPKADGAAAALLAVVERDGLALGLPVHAALSMETFDAAGLAAPDELLSALFDHDGAPLRVLDAAHLFARFSEAGLSREAGAGPVAGSAGRFGARRTPDVRAANATAYIVFEGDGMVAAPIGQVERIVSLRETATDGHGAMAWEDHAIPLRDLRAGATGADGHVMVVRSGEAHVGCIVARVHLLVPPGGGQVYRMGGAGAGWEFIAVDDGAAQASYRIVDLGALAA